MFKSSNRSQAWDRSLDRSHVDCGTRYGTHQGTHVGVYDCHPDVHRPVLESRAQRTSVQTIVLGEKEPRSRIAELRRPTPGPPVVLRIRPKAEVTTCRRSPNHHLFVHLQLSLRVFIDARTTNWASGMANGGHSITVLAPQVLCCGYDLCVIRRWRLRFLCYFE